MTTFTDTDKSRELMDILLGILKGGTYDLDKLKNSLLDNARFEDAGVDSLDITTFFIQVEDRYEVEIPDEEVFSLDSIDAVRTYLEEHRSSPSSQ